jgi:hypothetical protein
MIDEAIFGALDEAIPKAAPEDRAGLVAALAARIATLAALSLATPRTPAPTEPPTRYLSPEKAAALFDPPIPVKRIYEWGRRHREWYKPKSKRSAYVIEAPFRRWMESDRKV